MAFAAKIKNNALAATDSSAPTAFVVKKVKQAVTAFVAHPVKFARTVFAVLRGKKQSMELAVIKI